MFRESHISAFPLPGSLSGLPGLLLLRHLPALRLPKR
jgi:hypothetical protein